MTILLKKNLTELIAKYSTGDYRTAIGCAVLLNVVLFALMPGLLQTVPKKPELMQPLESIQVVRMHRPDSAVRKKKKPKPPEQKKKDIPKNQKPLALSKPLTRKIRLPFKLNPKLAAGPQTMAVPSLDLLSLEALDLRHVYNVNDLDAPLTPMVKVPPMYPMRAKRMGIQGWVKVKFLVNEEGMIEHIEILEAQPVDMFETSVMNCVSRWRFKPGTVAGIPVKTWAETTIRFEMEG